MSRLTEREQKIFNKRNAGLTFKQIAIDLGLCAQTVRLSFGRARRKIEYEKERLKPTELEVYKRALDIIVERQFPGERFKIAKTQQIGYLIDQARKELEDEHR